MASSTTEAQYPIVFNGTESPDNVIKVTKPVLRTEYLAGGYLGNADTLAVLRHSGDMFSGELPDSVIEQMLRDPEIFKCITVIKNGVLGDGVSFTNAVTEPVMIHPRPEPVPANETPEHQQERLARELQLERYRLGKKYAEFATRAFNNLEVPLREVLEDMLDALAFGNRVAEKIFESKYDREFDQNLLYFKRLSVKPRRTTTFVVDKFFNLVGLKARIQETDEEGKVVYKERVIPKEKFAILSYNSKNGDPRGTSMLRCAYHPWQLKMQLWPEYLRWLIYSAVPPIVGYTSNETDSRKVLRDANGDLLTDAAGNPVYESDVTALLTALKQVRNASAIALPHGAKVEAINAGVSGDPFKGFRDVLNEEIEMGLILQTLATSDSSHNTRAASQTHLSILDELVWKIKGTVRDMVTGMVKHLMAINFADFDESLLPVVSLGDTARREFAADVGSISQLHISGFLGESQKVGIDNILGLPARDSFSDREYKRQEMLEKLVLEEEAKLIAQMNVQQRVAAQAQNSQAGSPVDQNAGNDPMQPVDNESTQGTDNTNAPASPSQDNGTQTNSNNGVNS